MPFTIFHWSRRCICFHVYQQAQMKHAYSTANAYKVLSKRFRSRNSPPVDVAFRMVNTVEPAMSDHTFCMLIMVVQDRWSFIAVTSKSFEIVPHVGLHMYLNII